MENTYQDLITDIQSKNPKISGKLEGGKKFKIKSDFKPAGDQPEAIKKLVNGPKLYLPDKNDIHVLAAAIEGKASSIVTLNLRDFPNYELKKYGIRGVHPDELLYREALENFNLISGFVISILNDFNKNNANKLSEYRLLKKAKLNRLSKLFR